MRPGSRRRPATLFAIAFVLGLLVSQDAMALSPHIRKGVTAGAAMGASPGQVSLFLADSDQSVSSETKWGVTPQYSVGYAVWKNRLVLRVANQQWLYEQGVLAEDKLRINVQNWTLSATYYPANPQSEAGGLYVLAGIGLANARITILEPIEDDPHGNKFEEVLKEDEGGTSYQLGVGFEFRFISSFAAGISASYVYQDMSGKIFDDAWSVPLNLTLNWYW